MIFEFEPIGTVRSCYQEKFGIPRQSGIVPAAPAYIELAASYSDPDAFRGLDAFSHIWILFVFHDVAGRKWKATVRPPRLGGNRRIGVFASRSPFRPNPVGISVVRLVGIEKEKNLFKIHFTGGDLLNNTPVLDIKPYLPYADALPNAQGGYAHLPPPQTMPVEFTPTALAACNQKMVQIKDLKQIIEQILSSDPRPAYKETDGPDKVYGCKLFDFDLKWTVTGGRVLVVALDIT